MSTLNQLLTFTKTILNVVDAEGYGFHKTKGTLFLTKECNSYNGLSFNFGGSKSGTTRVGVFEIHQVKETARP